MTAAASPVDEVARAAGPHVAELLGRVEDRLSEVAAGHGELLARHAGATISAGGKRLRPLLAILAAGGPPSAPDGLVRAAVAVELVHSATLVHDDVLDGATLRRGRTTVVAAAGRGMATATGDLLFSRAFSELVAGGRADEVAVLASAGSALVRGELLQRADAWNPEVGEQRYLERCQLKTARLFEAAARLGALEGGAPADLLAAFGGRIGLAFQLLDDVLDVAGPAERTGKRRGADLLDGTVTLPLIVARQRDQEIAALDLRAVADDDQELEALCARIEATGALDEARARAHDMVAAAKASLHGLPDPQHRALDLVADGVVERYS